MATKPIEIHPSAVAELRSAVNWYLERNETAAIKFAAEVDRVVELVKATPRRWPQGDHGTRKFVLLRFPYALTFRERESTVQILAVAHGHRQPGYWRDRL